LSDGRQLLRQFCKLTCDWTVRICEPNVSSRDDNALTCDVSVCICDSRVSFRWLCVTVLWSTRAASLSVHVKQNTDRQTGYTDTTDMLTLCLYNCVSSTCAWQQRHLSAVV